MRVHIFTNLILLSLLGVFPVLPAHSATVPKSLNYDGVITTSAGAPVDLSNGGLGTQVFFNVMSGTCVLYRESASFNSPSGDINQVIGSGSASVGSAANLGTYFNSTSTISGVSYADLVTPCSVLATDSRFLRVSITNPAITADMTLGSVPYALYADMATDSESLGGIAANRYVSLASPVTPTNGQLLIGNGSGFSVANLTAGSGITITNSAGGISIAATGGGGTVTSVSGTAGQISVATGTTTPVLSLIASGVTAGSYGSATQVPVFTVDSFGRITGVTNTPISGISPIGSALTSGQIYVGSAGNLAAAVSVSGDATLSNTGALTLTNSGATAGTYQSVTVDAKGRVTAGTNPTTLAGFGITDAISNAGGAPSIQEGTFAAMPAAGTAGRIYVSTDTKKVYRDNGVTWDIVGSTTITDMAGTLPIAQGGTGAVTANGALNALLPLQTGNTGKVLSTDGTNTSWISPGGGGTVTNVSGTLPLSVATGTTTPVISIADSSYTAKGAVQFLTDAATSGISVAAGVANVNTGTGANQIVKLDGTAKLPAVDGSALTGLTLAQVSGVLPVAKGGTNSSTALNNNRIMASSGGAIVELPAMTNGQIVVGSTGAAPTVATLGSSNGINLTSGAGTLSISTNGASTNTASTLVMRDGTGSFSAGAVTNLQNILQGSTSGSLTLQTPPSFGSYSLTFPSSAGSSGQFLTTDGAGNLSWGAPTGVPLATYASQGTVQIDTNAATSGMQLTAGVLKLATSGVTAGTYGSANQVPLITVDGFGRVTSVTNTTISGVSPVGAALLSGQIYVGSAGNLAAAVALSGDATLSNTGALTLANSGATAGTYQSVTVDAKGRVTAGSTINSVLNSGGAPSIQEGTFAAMPAAGTAGRIYVSTDTKKVYRDNGVSWDIVGSTTITDMAGTLPIAQGGTGAVTANGALNALLPLQTGNTGKVLTTDGTNTSWTNASAGTVTNVTSANSYVTVATGTTTPVITANVGTAVNTLAAGNDSRIVNALQTTGGAMTGNLTTTAKIGIGTVTPTDNLVVHSSIAAGTSFGISTPGTSGTQQTMLNLFTKTNAGGTAAFGTPATTNGWQIYANGNSYIGGSGLGNEMGIGYYDGTANSWYAEPLHFSFDAGNTTRVGVNTMSPMTRLDVNGYVRVGTEASNPTCSPSISGAFKYSTGLMYYCNGSAWMAVGTGVGTVTSVTGVAPISVATGTTTPQISLSGVVGVANGGLGTGVAPSNGMIPIGNGTTYTAVVPTSTNGATVTPGAGSLMIGTNGATTNTANTLVMRDGTGGFASNLISGSQFLLRDSTAGGVTLQSPTTVSPAYTLTLPVASPSVIGQVLTASTTGVSSQLTWSTITPASISGGAIGNIMTSNATNGQWQTPSAAGLAVTNGANTFSTGQFINTSNITDKGLVIREMPGQTGNLIELQSSASTLLSMFDSSGNFKTNGPMILAPTAGFSTTIGDNTGASSTTIQSGTTGTININGGTSIAISVPGSGGTSISSGPLGTLNLNGGTAGGINLSSTSTVNVTASAGIKLGATGTAFHNMGTCVINVGTTTANSEQSLACPGLPLSNAVIVSCSPTSVFAGTWSTRADGTTSNVRFIASVALGGSWVFNCMWVQP